MMWAPHYLQPFDRRHRYHPAPENDRRRPSLQNWLQMTLNFSPMGWAIGAAIGVARGNPNCQTVCITGDGSYLMSGQEITTAAQEQLNIIYVILNDGVYGMVMHGQRLSGAEQTNFQLPNVNFAKLANAMGIEAYVIESPSDFKRIDFTSKSRQGPMLLDVRIDKEEVPPMKDRLSHCGSLQAI